MLRIVRSIFNLHVCAAICLSLMAANALLNIPEAVRDCCPNGCDKPTLQVPSLFKPLVDLVVSAGSPERQLFHQVSTPFTTVLCPTITGCPTTKSKVSYVIGGLFLVLLVPPHSLSLHIWHLNVVLLIFLFSVLFFSFHFIQNATNFERLRMIVMNSIIISIFLVYVIAVYQATDALVVFGQGFNETIGILACFLLAACVQNYLHEYRFRRVFLLRRNIKANFQRVVIMHDETEQLLLSVLPVHVAKKLKGSIRPEGTMAQRLPYSTILFCSICNFSDFLKTTPYEEAMWVLNDVVCLFDDLCDKYKIEKIKTNGPYYMALAGLQTEDVKSGNLAAGNLARFALMMNRKLAKFNQDRNFSFALRIGLHHGPCVSGVIGKKKIGFDIWGDSVNVASRMVCIQCYLLFQPWLISVETVNRSPPVFLARFKSPRRPTRSSRRSLRAPGEEWCP